MKTPQCPCHNCFLLSACKAKVPDAEHFIIPINKCELLQEFLLGGMRTRKFKVLSELFNFDIITGTGLGVLISDVEPNYTIDKWNGNKYKVCYRIKFHEQKAIATKIRRLISKRKKQ